MSFPLFATSPLPWAVLVLLVLVPAWRRLPRGGRGVGVALEVALVILMTPLGAHLLVRAVESRMPPAPACAAPLPHTVVVLSAGFAREPASASDFAALQALGLHRLFTGVDLWRSIPGARLVISGGGERIPEAVPMANLARQLGVPAADIVIEGSSRNTWENARDTAALAPAIPRRIWLVTSALHMPRALGAFRAWGFVPCAWPSDRDAVGMRLVAGLFMPSGAAVDTSSRALHELLGAVDYTWLEWRHRRAPPAAQPQTP